jgi:hypothetical protein
MRGEEFVDDHPVLAVINNPTPSLRIPSSLWWEFCLTDFLLLGNNYIRKVRGAGGFGPPVGLQFLPGDMCAPNGDYQNPLTNYIYRRDGVAYPITIDDMIHVRQGRDPYDIRVGRSRLVSGLKEIAADNKGSVLAFALAKNQGHISTLIGMSGREGADIEPPSMDEVANLEQRLNDSLTGDSFGSIKILPDAFKAEKMSFSPRELAMDEMRKKPEERIAALFGLPPVVVGFGAGLDRSTYNNFAEARQQAWEDGILPLQSLYADVLTHYLLPDYPETQDGDRIVFDNSEVRALADDVVSDAKRAGDLFRFGVVDRYAAKIIAGQEAEDSDRGVYTTASAATDTNTDATTDTSTDATTDANVKKNAIPVQYP